MSSTTRRTALLGSVSIYAFAFAAPLLTTAAHAATTEGIAQNAAGTVAINLYEQPANDDPVTLGVTASDDNPGAAAVARAHIFCAVAESCTAPGGFVQFASGDDVAMNRIAIDGSLSLEATADALGRTATATAFINPAIVQHAVSLGQAADHFEVSGSIDVLAAADATATDGMAFAGAVISQAIAITASGATGASVDFLNEGSINVGGDAHAAAGIDDIAVASAAAIGIQGIASASAAGSATAVLANGGSMVLDADALAISSGLAGAHATAASALFGQAIAANGNAVVSIANSGDILLSAKAQSTGVEIATAGAAAVIAIAEFATVAGVGDVNLTAANSDAIQLRATAQAAAEGTAVAQVFAGSAIFQIAHAASGDLTLDFANSGSIAIAANAAATGDVAGASAVAGGSSFAGAIFQFAAATTDGGAAAVVENSGTISIGANAHANGTALAQAFAFGGPGIDQMVFALAGEALASVNNQGLIALEGHAEATALNTATAAAQFARGVAELAVAGPGHDASAVFANGGTLSFDVDAHALAEGAALGVAAVSQAAVIGVLGDMAGPGRVQATLENDGLLSIDIDAVATGGTAIASALAGDAIFEAATTFGVGPVEAAIANNGMLAIEAAAEAHGEGQATAVALVQTGIHQAALARDGGASASLVNNGSVELAAQATADAAETGSAFAVATIHGITQQAFAVDQTIFSTSASGHRTFSSSVDPSGPARIEFENKGSLAVTAFGNAADGLGGQALAFATALIQSGNAADLDAVFDNTGTMAVVAGATARVVGTAQANVSALGLIQDLSGIAQQLTAVITGGTATTGGTFTTGQTVSKGGTVSLAAATVITTSTEPAGVISGRIENSGILSVTARAEASGGAASAGASAEAAAQQGFASSGVLNFTNSGSIEVEGVVIASGDAASAQALVRGVSQTAIVQESASLQVSNERKLEAIAGAEAHGGSDAFASAIATGIHQNLRGQSLDAAVTNAGVFTVIAHEQATGADHGHGHALAAGVRQVPFTEDMTSTVRNTGSFSVTALAEDKGGGDAGASATATGIQIQANELSADIRNSGLISVDAAARAIAEVGFAQALAVGIDLSVFARTREAGVETGTIAGTIDNSGVLHVVAQADGPAATGTVPGQSQATAIGIRLSSGANAAGLTNSGTILVEAVSAHGDDSRAAGIQVIPNGLVGDRSTVLTIDNSGTLVARQSTDGGATWRRGTALDVSRAPSATFVNLLGGSSIYGNIAIGQDDEINVALGSVALDGTIGAAFRPARGINAGALDVGLAGVGDLNITTAGNLILADARFRGQSSAYDGPAYVLVDMLTIDPGSTVTFQLRPESGGSQSVGGYSQIFTRSAALDGSLVLDVTTPNGLFQDSYSWDNLIDSAARTGELDECGRLASGTPLLKVTCTYDGAANVDVELTRVAFDAVGGSNRNGHSVATSLEAGYDPARPDRRAQAYAALFQVNGTAAYNDALNQLSGSAYANYLQSFASLGVRYNHVIGDVAACDVRRPDDSPFDCRDDSPFRIWGEADLERRTDDGDSEAGTAKFRRSTKLAGVDARVSDTTVVGVTAGLATNHARDLRFGDRVDADGSLLGAYVVYDRGTFYAKGIATYSWFDGDSRRTFDFGTLTSDTAGDPDASLFSLGLHGGARLALGDNLIAQPHVDFDYVAARLDNFTEFGSSGAELALVGSRSSRTFLTGGLKLAGRIGRLLPDVDVGYRYRFGDRRTTIEAALSDDGANSFRVLSAASDRNAFLAGVGVGGKIGRVNVKLSYRGEFASDSTSRSGQLRLVLPLGSSARTSADRERHR